MLDNKTKERIAQEAKSNYPMRSTGTLNNYPVKWLQEENQKAYVKGAEAEATRAAGLIEAYRELCKLKDEMLNNMKNKATDHYELIGEDVAHEYKLLKRIEALTDYNNPK